jgi:hypothetical protein
MLRNRQISANLLFGQHQVTTDLPTNLPSGALECFGRFFAGDVVEVPDLFSSDLSSPMLRKQCIVEIPAKLRKTVEICAEY